MVSSWGYIWVCLRSSVERVVLLRVVMFSTSFFGGILRVLVKWLGFNSLHLVVNSSFSISLVSLFSVFVEILICPLSDFFVFAKTISNVVFYIQCFIVIF